MVLVGLVGEAADQREAAKSCCRADNRPARLGAEHERCQSAKAGAGEHLVLACEFAGPVEKVTGLGAGESPL